MSTPFGHVWRFAPVADHLTFVLVDAEAESGVPDGGSFDNVPVEWRIGVDPYAIVVCTARMDVVPVVLSIHQDPPPGEPLDSFDHVVEADVELPSGKLAVTGSAQLPTEVEPVFLKPGRYRVRVAFVQTDKQPTGTLADQSGDFLEYRVTMWPTEVASGGRVLKQGLEPWAY